MGVNYSILDHNTIFLLNYEDYNNYECICNRISNYITFIDEKKILLYRNTETKNYILYIGNLENIYHNDKIDVNLLYRDAEHFNNFYSLKNRLEKFKDFRINSFIIEYEKDHICFNDSYMKQNMV
jgi:hypothetical protein